MTAVSNNITELNAKLASLKNELNDIRFKLVMGEHKDVASIGKKKKEIARVLTAINAIGRGHHE